MRVLITGAAGDVGSVLRTGLAGRYDVLRLADIRDCGPTKPGEEVMISDLSDPAAAARTVEGVDVMIHLAGIREEAPWDPIFKINVVGLVTLFEAARLAGVKRIVYASSHHAMGYYPASHTVEVDDVPRPDSRYGVSKIFGEALARMYVDKYGMSVITVRIGALRPLPETPRHLSVWLSPADMVRLAIASVEAPDVTYRTVYGVSANTHRRWSTEGADAIGYKPQDNASDYLDRIKDAPANPFDQFHGGWFTGMEFVGKPDRLL